MTIIWFALVLLCLLLYVVLAGYDLGIGIGTLTWRLVLVRVITESAPGMECRKH